MEYPIGIEMSKDYLSYEVSKAAYKLVHDVMQVQPESVPAPTATFLPDDKRTPV